MSLCTCTPVVLGKGAMSSVVQVLLFLFRQWRFPPRPISSHRATPFRLSRLAVVLFFFCRARKPCSRGKTEHTGPRKDHEQRPLSDSMCFTAQQGEQFQFVQHKTVVGCFVFPYFLKTYHGVVIHLVPASHARFQCASESDKSVWQCRDHSWRKSAALTSQQRVQESCP